MGSRGLCAQLSLRKGRLRTLSSIAEPGEFDESGEIFQHPRLFHTCTVIHYNLPNLGVIGAKTFMPMKRLLLSLMLLVASLASFAHDFEVDGIYYNVLSKAGLTCEVTYKGSDYSSAAYTGNVNIPSQVSYGGKMYNVTSIGSSAFWSCSSLTSVNIPNSVTSIGDFAFEGLI